MKSNRLVLEDLRRLRREMLREALCDIYRAGCRNQAVLIAAELVIDLSTQQSPKERAPLDPGDLPF